MNSVSIKEAIAFGGWYECRAHYFDQPMNFRLRLLSFERTTVAAIDPRCAGTVAAEGILWLLSLEVINLDKAPVRAWRIRRALTLTDAQDFEFRDFKGRNLENNRESGLHRFQEISDNPPLSPKIKAKGSIAFDLPDEENIYRLTLKEGSIKEA